MDDQAPSTVEPLPRSTVDIRCQQCARRYPNRKPTIIAVGWADDHRAHGRGIRLHVSAMKRKGERGYGHASGPEPIATDLDTGLPKVGAIACRNCGHRAQGPATRFAEELLGVIERGGTSLYA